MEFDLRTIVEKLHEVTEWHALGIQLKVPSSTLRAIEQDWPRDAERRKSEMVNAWLRQDSDASWEKLAQALSTVGYQVLSEELSQLHQKSECHSVQLTLYMYDTSNRSCIAKLSWVPIDLITLK